MFYLLLVFLGSMAKTSSKEPEIKPKAQKLYKLGVIFIFQKVQAQCCGIRPAVVWCMNRLII